MASGVVIAGTHSGSGKTSVTMALIWALRKRGVSVQPFKVGPDYIDPAFHALVAGRPSRNLDPWMMGEDGVRRVFEKWTSRGDIGVVEGVMGMFDGFSPADDTGSTAHVARLLDLPVVLVVDGRGISRSAAAMVLGYKRFDRRVRVEGAILNRTGRDAHFAQVRDVIEGEAGVRVIGCLPERPDASIPERHLGLVHAGDIGDLESRLEALGETALGTLDLEGLLALASTAGATGEARAGAPRPVGAPAVAAAGLPTPAASAAAAPAAAASAAAAPTPPAPTPPAPAPTQVAIAVAMDRAFHFYYRDNLDLLEELGARLVYFSPVEDEHLPPGVAGLYLGGGYPELHAARLEANAGLRAEILDLVRRGLPVYAECGGLMYLGRSVEDFEGRSFEMVGGIPGRTRMTEYLVNFGYATAVAMADSSATVGGMELRGHEFHRSVFLFDEPAIGPGTGPGTGPGSGAAPAARKPPTGLRCRKTRHGRIEREWDCGYIVNRVFASYLHLHFLGNPGVAERFVESCRQFAAERMAIEARAASADADESGCGRGGGLA